MGRVILSLYPADYRELLSADMLATFVRESHRVYDHKRLAGLVAFAIRTLGGFMVAAVRAHAELSMARAANAFKRPAIRLERMGQEARYAARRLARSPAFSIAAVLTLGLGIGGSAAMFTLVNRILLRPLPYPNAARVVALSHDAPGLDMMDGGQSWATFQHYREHAETLRRVALYQEAMINLTGGGAPQRVSLSLVTPSLFAVLGTAPALGRVLDQHDAVAGAPIVVLISEQLWRSRYAADSSVIGRTIGINGREREVVGVMPDRFAFPSPDTDVWMNITDERPGPVDDFYLSGVGLLAGGRSAADVHTELMALVGGLASGARRSPIPFSEWGLLPAIAPLKTAMVRDASSMLWILFGAVGIVLLVAGVNTTTLFLVRAAERQREIDVRRALGAVGRDMRHFFLSEALFLSIAAGAVGAVLAGVALQFVTAWGSDNLPRLAEVRPDGWMLGFTAALTVLIGMTISGVTARQSRSDSSTALMIRTGTAGSADRATHRALVAFQVAMAFALLVGAGLLLRSFAKLRTVELGFNPANVLTFDVSLPFGRYPTYERTATFFEQLVANAASLPGVRAAGAISHLPLSQSAWTSIVEPIEAATAVTNALIPVDLALVTAGYFEALGVPIVEGTFAEGGSRPVLLSAPLAERLFGEEPAVGRLVRRAGDPQRSWNIVSGVVGPVRSHAMHLPATDILYVPVLDVPSDDGFNPGAMTVVIRTTGHPGEIASAARGLVTTLDPELSISNLGPLSRVVSQATARWSFASTLLTASAATALLLGTVGLYAVLSFAVSRRAHEIGIRMALGARAAAVRWMIVKQSGIMAMAGLLGGLLLALAGARLLRGLLYELTPGDPVTLFVMGALVLATALIAGDIPARRAARVDPMRVLRGQ
jgi:predicted permease